MTGDWRDEALCAQIDPALFFPDKGQNSTTAKRICATCPVTAACLQHALDHNERYGVWGGTSERERRAIRVARQTPVAARGAHRGPHGPQDPVLDAEIARLTLAGLSATRIARKLNINVRRVTRARARNRNQPQEAA